MTHPSENGNYDKRFHWVQTVFLLAKNVYTIVTTAEGTTLLDDGNHVNVKTCRILL